MATESIGSRAFAYARGWSEKWARHLAAFTTVLTFLLILLGVYTAASGSGLACAAQWPLCKGGVLPHTLPDFIEWFHRFVAMITGFFILGTMVSLWLAYGSRRIRAAAAVALVATPVQAILGAGTVFEYEAWLQTAHHGAAMVIFAGLMAATLWAYEAGRGGSKTASSLSDSDRSSSLSSSDD
jgi:cytochrome c oxidase assembly protein subunit 15